MSSDPEKTKEEEVGDDDDDVVNPWDVASKSQKGVDYSKLISKYKKRNIEYHMINSLSFMLQTL